MISFSFGSLFPVFFDKTMPIIEAIIKIASIIQMPDPAEEMKSIKNQFEQKNIEAACLFESTVICKFLAWVEKNKEKILQAKKEYRENNKGEYLEYRKEWRLKNADKLREERKERRDELNAKNREYKANNQDKVKERWKIDSENRKKLAEADKENFVTCAIAGCFRRFFGGGRTRARFFMEPKGCTNEQGCWLYEDKQ